MHTNHILNVFVFFIEWYNHAMTKKIAKVVLNSVSHDARVIKEAQSLSEAGFDVSIIGIEDAKNDVPFENPTVSFDLTILTCCPTPTTFGFKIEFIDGFPLLLKAAYSLFILTAPIVNMLSAFPGDVKTPHDSDPLLPALVIIKAPFFHAQLHALLKKVESPVNSFLLWENLASSKVLYPNERLTTSTPALSQYSKASIK